MALSGGVALRAGTWQIGSRDPVRVLVLAAVLGTAAGALLGRRELLRLAGSAAGGRRAPARAAIAAAAAVLIVSTAWNTRAAGGSDSSCYVLQAEAFAHGRVALAAPLTDPPPGIVPLALAPTGFVPSPRAPHDAVPICAPGLALVMAAVFAAGRELVFVVVPLFAALAVWCTFLLGRALVDDVTGAWSAVLLACSPIFLYQAVQPMSDVPAAALWLAALVAARASPALAGFCASAAVLMRPNVALIAVPLLALAWQGADGAQRSRWGWLRFAGASLPLLTVMAGLNAARYGSPLASGYGATDALFSLAHVGPNLARYPRWLIETHTAFVLLAVAAPWFLWRRPNRVLVVVAACSVVLTIATYLAYTVFDDWWYIRFLLPALPVVLVFMVAAARAVLGWAMPRQAGWTAVASLAVLCVILCAWFVHVARERAVFELAALEARFRVTGAYAARALPANAMVLTVQQSGSIRYHGGRGTLAWDAIAPGELDGVVADLVQRGYTPFIALEDAEEPRFRARFSEQRFGGLAWPPRAVVRSAVRVRVYAAEDLEAYARGISRAPEIVVAK